MIKKNHQEGIKFVEEKEKIIKKDEFANNFPTTHSIWVGSTQTQIGTFQSIFDSFQAN